MYLGDQRLQGFDGIQEALCWVIPALNQHTFMNKFTPVQLALGRQPHIPGLVSDERTQTTQLSEEEHMRQTLQKRASAQMACIKADIDAKLRRPLPRQLRGLEADRSSGERCLYRRESNNKFHTIRWRGPAVVVAVQRDPDSGQVACYWLAHGTVLIRAGRHVKRLLDSEGEWHPQKKPFRLSVNDVW